MEHGLTCFLGSIVYMIAVVVLVESQEENEPASYKFLFLMEKDQPYVADWITDSLKAVEDGNSGKIKVEEQTVKINREKEDETYEEMCGILSSGASIIADLTWTGWYQAKRLSSEYSIPYIRVDTSIQPFMKAADDYLDQRNATDAALIFSNEEELDQGLYYLIENSILRVVVTDGLDEKSAKGLRDMRPSPSYYVIFATTENMNTLFQKANDEKLVYRYDRWNLVFTDFDMSSVFKQNMLNTSMSVLHPDKILCCHLLAEPVTCTCPEKFEIRPQYFKMFLKFLIDLFMKLSDVDFSIKKFDCSTNSSDFLNATKNSFEEGLRTELMDDNSVFYYKDDLSVSYKLSVIIEVENGVDGLEKLATWADQNGIELEPDQEIKPTKRFFRVGTAEAIPWSFKVRDPETGDIMLNDDGTEKWTGYCLDLIQELSEKMDFDYQLVIPKNGTFGKRIENNKWDGLVGDLATGQIDIAVAALIMTAEREEIVDFVAPYFEQTGILIVIRKAVRKTSLFKFMTVLRVEVWLSIVGALTVTAIMIWFLDKYSPYSARNNKAAYPYPCREFTLKESFWFALTSFTPQGGGEAPKALSGRTLVAAYWLFVVLMLATFTANLAAFLTVERMQSPVQSLEQLARQSRINYTVVKDSETHKYFINMKNAEDTLYRMWKELTLNASSDQSQYRVWDYPIKEQYGHILLAINDSQPVATAEEGFQMVQDHTEADFAFIHDSAEIRYEESRNCNLTIVGEVFSEKPYAIAVQQGSYLQEELSKMILDLQKDRYFETLSGKYWNKSAKGVCPNIDDSEGITLESLGGVFIATLFGLALAMVTLAGEIFYYKRKEKTMVTDITEKKIPPIGKMDRTGKQVTIGSTFKPVKPTGEKITRISHVSVFPRQFNP